MMEQCITHEEYFDSPPQRGTELLKETAAAAAEGYAPPPPQPPPTQAMPLLPTPPTDEPYLRLRREREEAEEGQLLVEVVEGEDSLTANERMPGYAREYFDQQQHHHHHQND